jgi:hypothetical protein
MSDNSLLYSEKSSNIIISNNCLGFMLSDVIYKGEYNNPFISTLIPEDAHFLKLCENFKYYMNCEPICDYNPSNTTEYSRQTNGVWYNNPAVANMYPIIHLGDIEIHCIHENTIDEALSKFKRRIERCRQLLESNNYRIFFVLTWTNLFTIHPNNDYRNYIYKFLSNNHNNDPTIKFIFLGPTNYIQDNYYIHDEHFDLNIQRRIDNVNIQIDFIREKDIIFKFLQK